MRVLVKFAVPDPSLVMLSAIVGVPVVFQATPLDVMALPPDVIVLPPLLAELLVMSLTAVVVVMAGKPASVVALAAGAEVSR